MQIVIVVSRILKLQFIRRHFSTGYIVYIVNLTLIVQKFAGVKIILNLTSMGFYQNCGY